MQHFDVFTAAKAVSALEAAQRYANPALIRKGRRSWCCCPIHEEKSPSCSFSEDGRFYCFGCHAGGTSIDLVAGLFDLRPLDAAKKICADYGLSPAPCAPKAKPERPVPPDMVDQAIRLLDSTVLAYLKWLDYRIRECEGDDERLSETLREREKMQRVSDELLLDDRPRHVELLIEYASWAAQTLETLRICAEATGEQYWGGASLCEQIAER